MTNKFSIYIDGNGYGFGNIGDDAILQGIIKILKTLPSNPKITIAVKHGVKLPFLDPDIHVAESFNFEEAKRSIANSDCLLVGGGTMVGDELGLQFPLAYNIERILYSKKCSKRIVLFGIGANKLTTRNGKLLAKMMINHSGLITLRDLESLKVCKRLSTNQENIFQTADPAFLLEPKETGRSRGIKDIIRSKGKTIGINVVNEVWANKKEYKMAIATTCNTLAVEGYYPIFFSNEIRSGPFYDHEANKETASLLSCDYTILEPTYYSPEEMIDIISAFDMVLSMRMHGLIFASIARVPFATISRIDKVDNFMNQFGLKSSGTIDTTTSNRILEDTRVLIIERDNIIANLEKIVRQKNKDCWKNQQYFTSYIEGRQGQENISGRVRLFVDFIRYHLLTRI